MRILIALSLFLLPFFGSAQINETDSNQQRHGLWKKQYPSGRLMYEGIFEHGKPVGEWKRYHEGGHVKAIINYSEKSDSAFTQLFNKRGKKIAEGNYLDREKAGKWVYFADGKKVAEEHFLNGKKHGASHKYYDSGELLESTEWENGMQEGDYEVFYKNGKPFMQCKYSNNQRNGLCLTFFQNGRIELEANYHNSLRDGNWKFYNENGEHLYTLKYNNGKILNPEVRDSIDNLQLENLEKGRNSIIDPEEFMQDPSEYMRKMNIYR